MNKSAILNDLPLLETAALYWADILKPELQRGFYESRDGDDYFFYIDKRCEAQAILLRKLLPSTLEDIKKAERAIALIEKTDKEFKKSFVPAQKQAFTLCNRINPTLDKVNYWFAYGLPKNAPKSWLDKMQA